jgi:hypothetical protein
MYLVMETAFCLALALFGAIGIFISMIDAVQRKDVTVLLFFQLFMSSILVVLGAFRLRKSLQGLTTIGTVGNDEIATQV